MTATQKQPPTKLMVFGPIELTLDPKGAAGSEVKNKVAADFQRKYPKHDWTAKQGCYVFALRNQGAPVPYYAGQSNRPLCEESVAPHKLLKYLKAVHSYKGTPVLYFIAAARPTKNDLPAKLLAELEAELIRCTVRSNSKALNHHGAFGCRHPYFIKGIAGLSYSRAGKADATSRDFASMFF